MSEPINSSDRFVLRSTDLNVLGKGLPSLRPMTSGERYENGIKKSMLKVKSNYKAFHEEADASSSSDFEDGGLSRKVLMIPKHDQKPDFTRKSATKERKSKEIELPVPSPMAVPKTKEPHLSFNKAIRDSKKSEVDKLTISNEQLKELL